MKRLTQFSETGTDTVVNFYLNLIKKRRIMGYCCVAMRERLGQLLVMEARRKHATTI